MDGTLELKMVNGAPVLTADGRGILLMYGLITGDIHTMRNRVDTAMQNANGVDELECIVLTKYPSFRVPDSILRYCFGHVKMYAHRFASIHFVDLPRIKMTVFRLACRTLPESLQKLVRITSSDEIYRTFGNICERSVSDTTTIVPAPPPSINATLLFTFDGKKHGNGGDWGSEYWKAKTFCVSSTHVWYMARRDDRLVSVPMSLKECKLAVKGDTATLSNATRSWTIRTSPENFQTFQSILDKDVSTKAADESTA